VAVKFIGKFSIVQNKRTMKVSKRCFYTKVWKVSKFKCYMSDILIQSRHTIAPTCNWWRGGNSRLLESFHLFKINEPRKFRCVAFIRKYKSFQSSNATKFKWFYLN